MRLFAIIVVVLGISILFFGISATYVYFSGGGTSLWRAGLSLAPGILVLAFGYALLRKA
jgi:hypothetical protein